MSTLNMVGKQQIDEIIERCDTTLDLLIEMGMAPNKQKVMSKTFSIKEICDETGKTRATINKYIKELEIEPENKNSRAHPRYSLKSFNAIRKALGTLPQRRALEQVFALLFQNYKGGVGKSVQSVHCAQFFAAKGLRVLIADCDPQASATTSFGYIPDRDFDESNTIGPYLRGEKDDLYYAVVNTYFENIDLIPGCLPLYESDLGLFTSMITREVEDIEAHEYYLFFAEAISTISNNYDIVIFDSPPTLGMTSINLLNAADGLVIPTPPSMYDFASTRQYLTMISRAMEGKALQGKEFAFIKVLANRISPRSSKEKDFTNVMKDNFGKYMLNNGIQDSQAVKNAAAFFKTIYDITSSDRDDEDRPIRVEKSVYEAFERTYVEILDEIYKFWGRE